MLNYKIITTAVDNDNQIQTIIDLLNSNEYVSASQWIIDKIDLGFEKSSLEISFPKKDNVKIVYNNIYSQKKAIITFTNQENKTTEIVIPTTSESTLFKFFSEVLLKFDFIRSDDDRYKELYHENATAKIHLNPDTDETEYRPFIIDNKLLSFNIESKYLCQDIKAINLLSQLGIENLPDDFKTIIAIIRNSSADVKSKLSTIDTSDVNIKLNISKKLVAVLEKIVPVFEPAIIHTLRSRRSFTESKPVEPTKTESNYYNFFTEDTKEIYDFLELLLTFMDKTKNFFTDMPNLYADILDRQIRPLYETIRDITDDKNINDLNAVILVKLMTIEYKLAINEKALKIEEMFLEIQALYNLKFIEEENISYLNLKQSIDGQGHIYGNDDDYFIKTINRLKQEALTGKLSSSGFSLSSNKEEFPDIIKDLSELLDNYLKAQDLQSLISAYRKIALQIHPDRKETTKIEITTEDWTFFNDDYLKRKFIMESKKGDS